MPQYNHFKLGKKKITSRAHYFKFTDLKSLGKEELIAQRKRTWTLLDTQERMMLIVHCLPADRQTHRRGAEVFKFHLSSTTPLH